MPDIIQCPHCERKLKVPETLRNQAVKCPTCGETFTASASAETSPPPPVPPRPAPAPAPSWENAGSPPPARADASVRPRNSGSPDVENRAARANLAPHRGTLILVLGILGLVAFGPLGIVAWVLGNGDLKEIREGRMDPEGEGTTNAGRICGMIASIMMGIGLLCVVGFFCLFSLLSVGAVGKM